MNVHARPFGLLRSYLARGQEQWTVSLREGATLGDLLGELEIPPGDVGAAVVGGASVWLDRTLVEGDRVDLFSVVGGG